MFHSLQFTCCDGYFHSIKNNFLKGLVDLSDSWFKEMGQLWIFNAYRYHTVDTDMHNKQCAVTCQEYRVKVQMFVL
jgi:hypothetical protein